MEKIKNTKSSFIKSIKFKLIFIFGVMLFFGLFDIEVTQAQQSYACANWCYYGSPHCGRDCWDWGCPCSPPACSDTSWSPLTSTVCSGDSFTQTSNCGNTRTATGTKYCPCVSTSWSPATGTVCSGTSFTQTGSPCGDTRTATGTKYCPPDTSGYNCNSSTGTCSYVSSGASYSSSSTCNANCSAPVSTSGYKCNSSTGSCYYVSSGADYSSSSTCNANCSAPVSTSGYKCNSSTGSCYYVSSGADYSSSSTCNANCSAPPPSCTANCLVGAWSACSAPCGGGTQSRTVLCTYSDCSTHTFDQTQACNTQACCVNTSWTPSTSTVCLGQSFTQTGSPCGGTRLATGTKVCDNYCDTTANGGYYCSSNNTLSWFSAWCNASCSSGNCGCLTPSYSCNPQSTNCGTDSCDNGAGATEHEYCQDGNVWSKYDGRSKGCAGTSCYNNHVYCGHYQKEACETGFTCKSIDANNADCVPKSSTWTEV